MVICCRQKQKLPVKMTGMMSHSQGPENVNLCLYIYKTNNECFLLCIKEQKFHLVKDKMFHSTLLG